MAASLLRHLQVCSGMVRANPVVCTDVYAHQNVEQAVATACWTCSADSGRLEVHVSASVRHFARQESAWLYAACILSHASFLGISWYTTIHTC